MQNNNEFEIKIKCRSDTELSSCLPSDKVFDLKCKLLRAWPLKWPRARVPTDLRFIFLGKELRDAEVMGDIKTRTKSDSLCIHLVIRERAQSSPGSTPVVTPTVHYSGSPVKVREGPLHDRFPKEEESEEEKSEEVDQEAAAHFHAVTVSERELSEFRIIFDKKKGPDGLIAIPTVRLVLQSYWRFIRREGFEANPGPFPEDRLDQLRRKIDANASGLTLDQFLTVFYLFDNVAAEEPCIHGARERVRVATAQLHSVLCTTHDFFHDKYEQLFSLVCGDENQENLTCKEMELLYYMYSAFVLDKMREEELVAKVQAIVRMKIQHQKYEKMVDAARRVQNAWRMRMFTADRNNHERITEFLRTMLHGQGAHKIGGPRI